MILSLGCANRQKKVVCFQADVELRDAQERLRAVFGSPDPLYVAHRPLGEDRPVGVFVQGADGLIVDLWVEDPRFVGPWATHFKGILKDGGESRGAMLEGHYVLSDALVAIGVLLAMAGAGVGFAIGTHVARSLLMRFGFALGGAIFLLFAILVTVSGGTGALTVAIRKALSQPGAKKDRIIRSSHG